MNPSHSRSTQELEAAFQLFAETSRQMELAYRELEERVAGLNSELAVARSERFRQLREKESVANRLERLLAALPAGVLVTDASGVIHEANPAAIDLLGEPLMGVSWESVRDRVLAPGSGHGHEVMLNDGRVVNIALRTLGSEPGQIVLIHDVTENHKLRALVDRQRSLANLGEMVARLAHQVRTPLASAVLYTSHLRTPAISAERRDQVLDKTLFCLRELERQVNDMLLFARSGQLALEPVDLGRMAEQLQQTLEPQLQAKGCELLISGLEGEIDGNHEALLGALSNLVSNALEVGAKQIQLTAQRDGSLMIFTVEDNGPGVATEIQHRIFDPFFTARTGGTGLGLAVVRTVIESHAGWVELSPSRLGGAGFRVVLPCQPAPRFLPSANTMPLADQQAAEKSLRRCS